MSGDGPRTHEDARVGQNGGDLDSWAGGAEEMAPTAVLGARRVYPEDGGQLSGASGLRQLAASRAEHVRPYGARDAFSRQVMALVADNRDWMLEQFNSPENVKRYVEAVTEGMKHKDKTCIRMMHEIYDLAGVKDRMVAEFLARVGVATLDAVEEKLQRIQDAATLTAEQRAAACVEYLELFLNKYPEQRQQMVRRLGGHVEVRSDSFARVVSDGPG